MKKAFLVLLILSSVFLFFIEERLECVLMRNGNKVVENGVTGCDCRSGGSGCQCYIIKR